MINTSGYRLSQMPQYSGVDPSLVALNPGAITQGIGQSFQLANLLEQVKAQRQRRQLMDAIMQGQIEAENARNQATTATAMPGAQNTLEDYAFKSKKRPLELAALEQTLPLEAETAAAQRKILPDEFKYKTAKLGSDLSLLEPVTQAKIAEANAAKAGAESALNLNALTETATAAKLNAGIKDIEDLDKIRESKINKALAENAFAVTKAKTEDEMFRAAETLKQEKTKAEIEHLKGMAEYYANGGAPKAAKDPASQIRAVGLAIKAIEDEHGLGGSEGYESTTYNSDNTLKRGGFLWLGHKTKNLSQEDALARVRELRAAQTQLIRNWVGQVEKDALGPTSGAITPAPRQATGPQIGAVVGGFRFKGGNPKNPDNWEKLSPIK